MHWSGICQSNTLSLLPNIIVDQAERGAIRHQFGLYTIVLQHDVTSPALPAVPILVIGRAALSQNPVSSFLRDPTGRTIRADSDPAANFAVSDHHSVRQRANACRVGRDPQQSIQPAFFDEHTAAKTPAAGVERRSSPRHVEGHDLDEIRRLRASFQPPAIAWRRPLFLPPFLFFRWCAAISIIEATWLSRADAFSVSPAFFDTREARRETPR